MPANFLSAKSQSYNALADRYLHEHVGAPQVSVLTQQEALLTKNHSISGEHFYLVLDVKTNAVLHCRGVQATLGYDDKSFSRKKYSEVYAPSHAFAQAYFAAACFQVFINKPPEFIFLKPFSIATLAIRNNAGNYLYCLRKCSPFQICHGGHLLQYISEFTIIKEFANEPFHARAVYGDISSSNVHDEIFAETKKKFAASKCFSTQELRIIKRYAQNESTKSGEVAKAFRIEKNTVNTYNKRIITKAENIFGEPFSNAKAVSSYLKNLKLI